MLPLPSAIKIFLYTQAADMRSGFHKLSMLAKHFMQQYPLRGHLFVFFNKTGDKYNILFWDRSGFVIWYKRLQEGTFEKLSCKDSSASIEVDLAILTWILEGIDLYFSRLNFPVFMRLGCESFRSTAKAIPADISFAFGKSFHRPV